MIELCSVFNEVTAQNNGKTTIVWDFDGTILPLEPYDSEQTLLIHVMNQTRNPLGYLKKGYARIIVFADQHERLRWVFKASYIRLLKGTTVAVIDEVCRNLAEKILSTDRDIFRKLKEEGHNMIVLSCGTADLSERILKFAGIFNCFSLIEGNRFQFDADRISGMQLRVPNPDDKLALVRKLNFSPNQTIVVGDGYTDLPLLNWSAIPVLINRGHRKKENPDTRYFDVVTSIPEILNIVSAKENLISKEQKNDREKRYCV